MPYTFDSREVQSMPLVRGSLRAPEMPTRGATRAEIDAVLEAISDGRDVRERTLDTVVDKLLKELTW